MTKINISAENNFQPFFLFRSPHFQSIMASSRLRLGWNNEMENNAREVILKTSGGSRLLSFLSRHPQQRGMVIFLHGWEGSSSSVYIRESANYFYRLGFTVGRLNLRDHGDSHHLNEGLFHGARLQETFEGVENLATFSAGTPVYLVGFSLGGNFALRIAMRHGIKPIANLKHVFAVSPPLDPYKTTLAIDNGYPFYRKYFLKKWKRSLLKKQSLFPHKYDFSRMLKAETCIELTEMMMPFVPELTTYRDYFKLYTLGNEDLQNLNIPVRVFIAEDDPVIPHDDYRKLEDHRYLRVSRQKFGGHCGFLNLFPARCWYNQAIAEMIA